MAGTINRGRRRFVGATLVALVATTIPRPAFSIAPAVVLAVAQFAISVIGLLRRSGSSIGALLQLQVEMLSAISSQLVVIQQGIASILSQLNEIQDALGQLPGEVVDELYRRRVGGLLGTYAEIMAAYQADLQRGHGILVAQSHVEKEIEEELLRPMREVRSVLMAKPSYLNAPILAAALQCEVHAMIMAGYRAERVKPALARYRAYFVDALDTQVGPLLADLRTQRAEELAKVQVETSSNFLWRCMARRERLPEEIPVPMCHFKGIGKQVNHFRGHGFMAHVGEYVHKVGSDAHRLGGIYQDVLDITAEGFLTTADYPLIVEKDPASWVETVTVHGCPERQGYSSHPALISPAPDWMRRMESMKACKSPDDATEHDDAWIKRNEVSITSSAKAVSFAAIEVVCKTAIASLDAFDADVSSVL